MRLLHDYESSIQLRCEENQNSSRLKFETLISRKYESQHDKRIRMIWNDVLVEEKGNGLEEKG